ncbi:g5.4 [Tranosema rostrale ichnovirus]|nr:g5.4 [Tranosema rostrale ichnovirus]
MKLSWIIISAYGAYYAAGSALSKPPQETLETAPTTAFQPELPRPSLPENPTELVQKTRGSSREESQQTISQRPHRLPDPRYLSHYGKVLLSQRCGRMKAECQLGCGFSCDYNCENVCKASNRAKCYATCNASCGDIYCDAGLPPECRFV